MGSYAQCWLGNLYLGSSKNDIDIDLLSLFRQKNKYICKPLEEQIPIHLTESYENIRDDPEFKYIYYEAPVNIIRDRLNLLGYNLPTAIEAFKVFIDAEQNRNIEMITSYQKGKNEWETRLAAYYKKINQLLADLTAEEWIENIKKIRSSGLKNNSVKKFAEQSILEYMLTRDWYGYTGGDLFIPLRLIIETCETEDKLLYDLTELVSSGYFGFDDDFIEFCTAFSSSEYRDKSKTIVLTEGKTDAWILEMTLDYLYPHLKDYFSFLDFESTGFGGGVGNLVNVVKAFSGAGIVNNVIALFDNDTAALSACKGLNTTLLPPNIAIIHLPEIDLLRNYPTIGPSGNVNLDINGIAASLELYLGVDVLKIDGKNFIPIQWTGYEKSVKRYQGEVLEKVLLQDRFKEKLDQARNGVDLDWQDLQAVFRVIFSAFSQRNREEICRRASMEYCEE